MRHVTWKLDHNPLVRPKGCNGKPGDSGRNLHRRRKEPVCKRCREASNWTKRERNRGQPHPRWLEPCGTFAAAQRHRYHDEPLCIPCQIAEAKYHADLRAQKENTMNTEAAIQKGLEQSAAGDTVSLGDFTQYACEHEDTDNQGVCLDCEATVENWEPSDGQIPGTYEIRKAAA